MLAWHAILTLVLCRTAVDSCDNYSDSGPFLSVYATMGFHLFDMMENRGLWLTQILAPFGEFEFPPSDCPEMEYHVNSSLVNANLLDYDYNIALVVPNHIATDGSLWLTTLCLSMGLI
jgi:hypothetical protein